MSDNTTGTPTPRTPRTDAVVDRDIRTECAESYWGLVEHARTLERELAEAKVRGDEADEILRAYIKALEDGPENMTADEAENLESMAHGHMFHHAARSSVAVKKGEGVPLYTPASAPQGPDCVQVIEEDAPLDDLYVKLADHRAALRTRATHGDGVVALPPIIREAIEIAAGRDCENRSEGVTYCGKCYSCKAHDALEALADESPSRPLTLPGEGVAGLTDEERDALRWFGGDSMWDSDNKRSMSAHTAQAYLKHGNTLAACVRRLSPLEAGPVVAWMTEDGRSVVGGDDLELLRISRPDQNQTGPILGFTIPLYRAPAPVAWRDMEAKDEAR